MSDVSQTLLVAIALMFAFSGCYIVVVGVLFDFWLEHRHQRQTGRPLISPMAAVPLFTPFRCGMVLLAPDRAATRGHCSSIQLARPVWRWLAVAHVPMTAAFCMSLLAALWWLPGR